MNIERINDYIDAYSEVINISPTNIKTLKELMPKIIMKYEKVVAYVTEEEDKDKKYIIKPVNGKYSIEDFFLNRLMRNILYYDNISFVQGGFYDAEQYLVSLNEDIIKTRVSFLKKYVELSDRDVEKFNQIAEKKTRMHEIEHGLQAQFVDGNPPQDIIELYQKLIKSICNKKKVSIYRK